MEQDGGVEDKSAVTFFAAILFSPDTPASNPILPLVFELPFSLPCSIPIAHLATSEAEEVAQTGARRAESDSTCTGQVRTEPVEVVCGL